MVGGSEGKRDSPPGGGGGRAAGAQARSSRFAVIQGNVLDKVICKIVSRPQSMASKWQDW